MKPVLIDACRTPFARTGSAFKSLMAYQLGKVAIRGLIDRNFLTESVIEQVIMGNVIRHPQTENVARDSALFAGLPFETVCQTIAMADISAGMALVQAADAIRLGRSKVAIAGGTECISDTPVIFPRKMQKKLLSLQQMEGFTDYIRFAANIRPSDFRPKLLEHKDLSNTLSLDEQADRLADLCQISRAEQDAYAARSHALALAAEQNKWNEQFKEKVCFPPDFEAINKDNGILDDNKTKDFTTLAPICNKIDGTTTTANSTFTADGAAAVLLMEELKALELGYQPKAVLKDSYQISIPTDQHPLLAPVHIITHLLHQNQLSFDDVVIWEIHEAYASQILAIHQCLSDPHITKQITKLPLPTGSLSLDQINHWGGSLAYGHPTAATFARLTTNALHQMTISDAAYAVVVSSSEGGYGLGILLEKWGI